MQSDNQPSNTNKTETSNINGYTIAKDFEHFTVLITKPSPRSRLGIQIVHHYSFKSSDISKSVLRMNAFVDKFIEEQNAKEKARQERKSKLQQAKKDFVNPFTLGQILYRTWGYEQTNVNFYQVVKVDRKSIVVRELSQDRTQNEFMSGTAMPIKDDFNNSTEIKKIVQIAVYNEVINIYVTDMHPWKGTPVSWSSYH